MRNRAYYVLVVLFLAVFVTTLNYGCGGGGGGGSSGSSAPAIAAPSNLQVTKSGYIYLTWTDNSNNETNFIVYTRPEGGGWSDMGGSGWVTAGTTAWNDEGMMSYWYPNATKIYFGVTAMASTNVIIESNLSNVVSVTLP